MSYRHWRRFRQSASNTHTQKRGQRSNASKSFDPTLLVQKATEKSNVVYIPHYAFGDFSINDQLKKNISDRGYEKLTPIQDKVIPLVLEGKDVVGVANTGTGKTAAFLIPLIHKTVNAPASRVLIIAPTRELAAQIEEEFRHFSRELRLSSTLCIGGVNINRQMGTLRRKPHFIIGTPGRLKDLEQRNELRFDSFSTVVLDEVDRMLDMGFIQDMRYIISRLPGVRQSLFFSATIPEELRGIMNIFLTNPIFVSVAANPITDHVDQDVIKINGREKIDILHDLLIQKDFEKVLVFGRTKHGMNRLARALHERGFRVAAIHGNKSQNQRQLALRQFKENAVQVLLATDVASRGLDIDDVTHVINFDLPQTYEDYVHRIGRTGRADKTGKALSFVE